MTDQYEPETSPPSEPESRRPRRRRRWLGYLLAGVVGAAIGAAGLGFGLKHAVHRGWHDEARFERFVDHRLERMLDEVDASAEQRAKVKGTLMVASRDMRDLARSMRDDRTALMAALSGPSVDRAAIEALRAQRLAEVDATSQRALTAMADAAAALTPAQRAKLAERFQQRRWRD